MPCYHPITAYRSARCVDVKSGKPKIFFKEVKVQAWPGYETLQVPCGRCIGCRLERSRQWAVRCVHEASLHDDNCFITLTFRDERLPADGSLKKFHFQRFMKRLRKQYPSVRMKYFHCGEYGDKKMRPHYHACIFGFDFPDKVHLKTERGHRIYISEVLTDLWTDPDGADLPAPAGWFGYYNPKSYGYCTIGAVTFESAAYVARYVLKKWSKGNLKGEDLYKVMCDPELGDRIPEYVTMSRGGRTGKGLAHGWYERYKGDVFPCDNVVLRGKVMRPPKYYDRLFEIDNLGDFTRIKADRQVRVLASAADNTPDRLATKEICKLAQVAQLKRGLRDETKSLSSV